MLPIGKKYTWLVVANMPTVIPMNPWLSEMFHIGVNPIICYDLIKQLGMHQEVYHHFIPSGNLTASLWNNTNGLITIHHGL